MTSSLRPAQFQYGGGFFRKPPYWTLRLMILTAALSVAAMFDVGAFGSGGTFARQLLFAPSQLLDGLKLWTPFTFLFVVPSPFGFLLHVALVLWMFASSLERLWGGGRFLLYFFVTGVGSALLTTLLGVFIPTLRVTYADAVWVVADAVILAWVLMNWHGTALLYIIPVPAPFLLVLPLGMAALSIIMGAWAPTVTPLLAMGIGYLMLRRGISPRRALLHLRAWWIERQLKRRARHLRVVPPSSGPDEGPKGPRYLN